MSSTTVVRSQMRHNSTQMVAAALNAARSVTAYPCALRYRCSTGQASYPAGPQRMSP
jgi:hypothetical protein